MNWSRAAIECGSRVSHSRGFRWKRWKSWRQIGQVRESTLIRGFREWVREMFAADGT